MQIHVTGRHLEITPAIKKFTDEKFQRLEKLHQPITQVNLILHTEHGKHIAEATLHVDGIELHAKAVTADMYQTIDEVVDKLLTQVTKHKDKLSDHHR